MFRLARIQLDYQLFVYDRLHLFPRRDARDFAAERVAIGCQPVGHGNNLRKIKISQHQLAGFRFVFNRDLVACLHVVGSDIHGSPVHEHMAVRHKLARSAAGISKAKPVNDIIDTRLQ